MNGGGTAFPKVFFSVFFFFAASLVAFSAQAQLSSFQDGLLFQDRGGLLIASARWGLCVLGLLGGG